MLDVGNSVLSSDLYKKFVADNKKHFDQETTYLEVASFNSLAEEMKNNWDDSKNGFRYFFENKSFEHWRKYFKRLHDSRNACAHDHPEFLSESDIKETNLCCQKLQQLWKNLDL